jgi:valyl-tRNA synthetase
MLVAPETKNIILKCHDYIEKLAGVSEIGYIQRGEAPEKASAMVTQLAEIYISLGELIDTAKEIQRLAAEIEKVDKEIERSEKMLDNKGFVQRAPQSVVEAERVKLISYRDKRDKLNERMTLLK